MVGRSSWTKVFCRDAGRLRRSAVRAAVLMALTLAWGHRAFALDTDIFTGTQVKPNIQIIFDNSGSMGSQAYNTYPNTIYSGSRTPGTV
jgi:hypothetical protein